MLLSYVIMITAFNWQNSNLQQ